jgi:hypothetical protein
LREVVSVLRIDMAKFVVEVGCKVRLREVRSGRAKGGRKSRKEFTYGQRILLRKMVQQRR